MLHKTVVMVSAWLEIVAGASFLTALDVPCRMLFAATPQGVGIPLTRFAGVALVALGIACLPSKAALPRRSAVLGLLVYNAGATVLLAWIAIATTFRGNYLVASRRLTCIYRDRPAATVLYQDCALDHHSCGRSRCGGAAG